MGAPQRACELDALQRLDAVFPDDPWTERMDHACDVGLTHAHKLRQLRGLAIPTCAALCVDPPPVSVRLPTGMQCIDASLHARLDAVSTADLPARARRGPIATPFELDVVRARHGDLAAGARIRVWHQGGTKDGVTQEVFFNSECGADVESAARSSEPFELCILPAGDGWIATCSVAYWTKHHATDVAWWKKYCGPIPDQRTD